MNIADVVARELQDRGFTAGLITGYFKSVGARWAGEFKRCRTEDDAKQLAADIARELFPLSQQRSMRLHDFRCDEHGVFEEMFTYNVFDDDALAAAQAQKWPCPRCQSLCAPVTLRSPGIGSKWSVQFGGHKHDADDFDARVEAMANPKKEPRFYEKPGFQEQFLARFEETAVKTMAGELPSPPQIAPERAAEVAAAITKGV